MYQHEKMKFTFHLSDTAPSRNRDLDQASASSSSTSGFTALAASITVRSPSQTSSNAAVSAVFICARFLCCHTGTPNSSMRSM